MTAFVGMNENYTKFEQTSGNGNDFIIPGLSDIKNTVGQSVGYNFSEREISSVFGSLLPFIDGWCELCNLSPSIVFFALLIFQ